jgi:flagellar basal body-associated protein FliL
LLPEKPVKPRQGTAGAEKKRPATSQRTPPETIQAAVAYSEPEQNAVKKEKIPDTLSAPLRPPVSAEKKLDKTSVSPSSIELLPFACRIESRKDIVIYLSLELFFNDRGNRSALLLRREDMKVMAMRTLRDKEPGAVTTGKLEGELRAAINGIFGNDEIIAVKIKDIRIEKAVRQ